MEGMVIMYSQENDIKAVSRILQISEQEVRFAMVYYGMPIGAEDFPEWSANPINRDTFIKIVSGKFSCWYLVPDPNDKKPYKTVRRYRYQKRRYKLLYPYRPAKTIRDLTV